MDVLDEKLNQKAWRMRFADLVEGKEYPTPYWAKKAGSGYSCEEDGQNSDAEVVSEAWPHEKSFGFWATNHIDSEHSWDGNFRYFEVLEGAGPMLL